MTFGIETYPARSGLDRHVRRNPARRAGLRDCRTVGAKAGRLRRHLQREGLFRAAFELVGDDDRDRDLADGGGGAAEFAGFGVAAQPVGSLGQLEADRSRKLLARQGDALLERVALARALYAGLKRTAEAERSQRGKAGK